ncbi:hypothetical protein BUALT_Bualt05G0170200 [Buddleja alternifolia]|uniref:Bifunctional inhibitor/plant lipid transfer protein/seed storage helical domain-containing protein n=1 Tax=Buddleja alternifolia TaxID=168488 RepID=A0AAV6XSL4_9LAMI|nr:hypothetical protein BUALT_Bualt05G0170200 [Buddleja alternifolia]
MKKMGTQINLCMLILCVAISVATASAADDKVADKCSTQFQKVTACLPFATAKAVAPSKECCGGVTDMKNSDPACLCYIIQQIHNGTNEAVKSMGLQEARLLQLPSACKLANASVTECPRLLHLPPNSPDAAVFTNASTATPTTPIATPGTSSPTTAANTGFWHKPQIAGSIIVALLIISISAFPTGLLSL